MTVIKPRCHFYGKQFSPLKAEQLTGLNLDAKNEVGELGRLGRYKGQPIPYGSASLTPCEDKIQNGTAETWLLEMLTRNLDQLIQCGADDIWLDYGVFYREQCNFEFSPETLAIIGSLGIKMSISCYKEDEVVSQ